MRYKTLFFMILSSLISCAHASAYVNVGGGVTEGSLIYYLDGIEMQDYSGELNGVGQVGLGYSHVWGTFLGGIEAGFEWQGFDAQENSTLYFPSQVQVGQVKTRLENDYYIHLKPGYVVNNDFVAYGILGVLGGNFTYRDANTNTGAHYNPQHKTTQVGYRAGLGVANLVKNHWEWRVEYTYNGYASFESDAVDPKTFLPLEFERSNIAISQVLVGASYHF